MSNREVVEELIRRMNARDVHPTELCHPDVEWHWPASTPGSATFRGHDGVTEGLAAWLESWEELVMDTEEIREDGLLKRWWMFGDAEKARRRFLAGDRPG